MSILSKVKSDSRPSDGHELTDEELNNSNGRSRPGHKVSGTQSKLPNLNENGQNPRFSRGFSDSEPGQNYLLLISFVSVEITV